MVSVIIPVYNASQFLEKSVRSILNQSYENIEVLICDDGSTDSSLQVIQEFRDDRIRIFENIENKGYLNSINFLVSMCKGEFIAFQDADDWSHHERLERQVNFLKKNPNISLVGTNFSLVNGIGKVVLEKRVEEGAIKLKKVLQYENPFQKPSIMFRKEIITSVGMFREGFLKLGNISEDFDWILRVSEKYEVANINHRESLYFYRSVPSSMTKSFKNVEQFFGSSIALFLAEERKKLGIDSLQRGDIQKIKDYIKILKVPYEKDKSLFHHQKAAGLVYSGLYSNAILEAWNAVILEPSKFKNYRLLQYCIRRYFRRN